MESTRITRSALIEISQPLTAGNRTPTSANNIAVPSSVLTPSPDEHAIMQRGRRSKPNLIDGDIIKFLQITGKSRSPLKSPFKSPLKRNIVPTRCSPRKRLQLDDCVEPTDIFLSPSTPSKRTRSSCTTPVKKARLELRNGSHTGDWQEAVEGLTHQQLISLLGTLVDKHPELESDIVSIMPSPDLKEYEKTLDTLKRNIFKSMPYTKWGSNRDAFCFRRVNVHLTEFKKICIEQGKTLLNSHHYQSTIEYVCMAWSYVFQTPDWDNGNHNKSKQSCFKSLATICMTAIKKSKFNVEYYEEILSKLIECKLKYPEIEPCVALVEKLISKSK